MNDKKGYGGIMKKNLQWVLMTLIVATSAANAGESKSGDVEKFIPNIQPRLEITKTTAKIIVDGELNDAGWVGVARATNFTQGEPIDMTKPSSKTVAMLTYDDENLYVAISAFDDNPDAIRSTLRDRDKIFFDDYVGFMLDTYGDASWAYQIYSNASGIQGDARWTQRGEDESFDIVFSSAGRITEDGYQVEFSVPFASLRFPEKNVQDWKITFWRVRPRESREEYSWAAISKNDPNFLGQFGTVIGIENVKPGKQFEILPSFVSSQSGTRDINDPNSSFQNSDVVGDASVGVRYGISSNTSLEATINPDFSQVESDAGQIDVNRAFALFFPEKRPFFQEGSDLLNSFFNIVHTRSINDPSFATKLTSRTNKLSYAYIGAVDERSPLIIPGEEGSNIVENLGKSYSNILRVRRSFREDSHVGAFFIDRRIEGGGSGSNLSVDSNIRFKKVYNIELQGVFSNTSEVNDTTLTEGLNQTVFDKAGHTTGLDGESYNGNAVYASFERHGKGLFFDFDYWHSSPTFRADNGFQTGNHFRQFSLNSRYSIYPENSFIDRIRPGLLVFRQWNYDGQIKNNALQGNVLVDFKGQTSLFTQYGIGPETFRGRKFVRQWTWFNRINSNYLDEIGFSVYFFRGVLVARFSNPIQNGEITNYGFSATIKPIDRLVIEPNFDRFKLVTVETKDVSDGYIFRTRTDYQFTKELFIRFVVQYNDFNRRLDLEPLLTYKINPFSQFFIGSTHGSFDNADDGKLDFVQADRQYFMKFQYLFRI